MTGEEMERRMSFILEQQAQITVKLGSLVGTVETLSRKVDRNAESVTALLAVAEIQSAEIRDLSETTRALADRQREAEERGRQTDERLNALINIVERYISEGRNGKA